MYLWSVKALAEDFKADGVTQKDQMKYYLLYCLAITFLSTPSNTNDSYWGNSSFHYFNLALGLIITFWGIIWCFRANQQGDNKDFVSRSVCLGIPIGIRLLAYYIVIGIMYAIFIRDFNDSLQNILSLGFNYIISIFYFVLLRRYLLYISADKTF